MQEKCSCCRYSFSETFDILYAYIIFLFILFLLFLFVCKKCFKKILPPSPNWAGPTGRGPAQQAAAQPTSRRHRPPAGDRLPHGSTAAGVRPDSSSAFAAPPPRLPAYKRRGRLSSPSLIARAATPRPIRHRRHRFPPSPPL